MRLLHLPIALLHLFVALRQMLLRGVLLAVSQIWANKGRSALTTIGIVIGVAAVAAVIAALTGLKASVLKDFESFGARKIYIGPYRPETGPKKNVSWRNVRFQPKHFDGLIENCPSLSDCSRIAGTGNVQARSGTYSETVVMIGVEPSWHELENRFVTAGRALAVLDDEHKRNVCLITEKLRDQLRLDRDCVGESLRLDNRRYTIVGILEPPVERAILGGQQRSEAVYVPFETYWIRFGHSGFMYAMAACDSPEVSEEAQAEVRFFLRKELKLAPGEPDTFRIEAVQKYIDKFKQVAMMITLVAGGIVGISLMVGGVGIMNIMLVSVSERTREIGLRKAVGARPAAILLQFLVEAVVLCMLGGAIGLAAGQGITVILRGIPAMKLQHAYIPAWAVMLSFGFAGAVGVTFGMFPAVKAARLDPIEALRHE